MAGRAIIAPPRREETQGNIQTAPDSGKPRYINFRVDEAQFEDVKIAALKAKMSLGAYLLHAHEALKVSSREDK